MALSYKSRKRWAIFLLVIALPTYIIAAVTAMTLIWPDPTQRPPVFAELAIYVGLGVLWALPFKFIFKGIGQADPDDPKG